MSIIYIHRNLVNGKVYICQTKTTLNVRARKDGSGYKGCLIFYNAIQKYGWENFSHAILEKCSEEDADDREKFWISFFNSTNPEFGYNNLKGGKFAKDKTLIKVGVYCKETGQYFKSLSDAAEWGGLQRTSMNDISRQIEGRRISAGKHPETGAPLHWCISKDDLNKPNKVRTSHNAKGVIDLSSGKIYISINEASKDIHLSYPSIRKCCDSKGKNEIKKHKLMYLEDYYNENLNT